VQLLDEAEDENDPAEHETQVEAVKAPVAAECVPAWHSSARNICGVCVCVFVCVCVRNGYIPCARNGYIPCAALHELRELLASTSPVRAGAPRTSLRDALEALTGMQGCHWKEIEGLAPEDGLELEIPVLQQALRDRSDFTMNEWHQMNVWGLQSRHYVRVGNRIMKPQRQRNHKLAKWLKNAGWRIDMTSMDNMFATFNAHNHYFVIHWNPQNKVFELCDPLGMDTSRARLFMSSESY